MIKNLSGDMLSEVKKDSESAEVNKDDAESVIAVTEQGMINNLARLACLASDADSKLILDDIHSNYQSKIDLSS